MRKISIYNGPFTIHHSLFTIMLSLTFCINSKAQSNMDNVLVQIGRNNKTIQATAQYYEAQKLLFKTSNTPSKGGLLTSTLLNIFIVPVVYYLANRKGELSMVNSE